MATHSNIPAWKIAWIEEPGRLQSMGSQRVRHDLVADQQQWCVNDRTKSEIKITMLPTPYYVHSTLLSRQQYWSGLPFPPPGNLPNPGTEPMSPVLQAVSLLMSHWGSPTRLSLRPRKHS